MNQDYHSSSAWTNRTGVKRNKESALRDKDELLFHHGGRGSQPAAHWLALMSVTACQKDASPDALSHQYKSTACPLPFDSQLTCLWSRSFAPSLLSPRAQGTWLEKSSAG